jgi:hypothetical protein
MIDPYKLNIGDVFTFKGYTREVFSYAEWILLEDAPRIMYRPDILYLKSSTGAAKFVSKNYAELYWRDCKMVSCGNTGIESVSSLDYMDNEELDDVDKAIIKEALDDYRS